MRLRPPQTYREFLKAGALSLSVPTMMFASLATLSARSGSGPFAIGVVGLWALGILATIVTAVFRVESLRRVDRQREGRS